MLRPEVLSGAMRFGDGLALFWRYPQHYSSSIALDDDLESGLLSSCASRLPDVELIDHLGFRVIVPAGSWDCFILM